MFLNNAEAYRYTNTIADHLVGLQQIISTAFDLNAAVKQVNQLGGALDLLMQQWFILKGSDMGMQSNTLW